MEFISKFLYFSLLSVIALFLCAHVAQSVGHDSNIGFCSNFIWNRSVPLMTKTVHKQNNRMFKMFRKTELEIRFPANGDFSSPIKCIMIKDNARDGSGGFATVKSGGINYRNAVIYFRSQRGGDINFDVGIYSDAPSAGFGGGGGGGGAVYAPQPAYTASQIGWRPQPQPIPPQQPYGWVYPPNQYGR